MFFVLSVSWLHVFCEQFAHAFLGAAEDMAHSSLRFGLGRFTTEAEVDFVVEHIVNTLHRLREMRLVVHFLDRCCSLLTDSLLQPTVGDGSRGH